MQRKEAEKLLAALIFDDLDETSKTELLNYLQTDNELRERLADMRMAVKVASDTVKHGPDPVLGKRRLKHLAKLARHARTWMTFFTAPRLAAAAAILIVAVLALISIQQFGGGVAFVAVNDVETKYELANVLEKIEPDSAYEHGVRTVSPSDSASRRTPEITFTGGRSRYAYDPTVRGPEVGESITGMNDNALIQKQTLEDMINYRRQIEMERKKNKEGIDALRKTDEASIPYAGNITYPDRWQEIIASPYRKPEEPLGQDHYALAPEDRGPVVIDRITSVNNEKDFTKNKIGGITRGQQFSFHGSADSSPKTGPTNLWDSGSIVAGSTLEGGQSSEIRGGSSDDVGEYRPWWARDHGAVYGDKNGDGIILRYPATGFGGMGGYGGMGFSGGGMGGYGGGGYGYSGPGENGGKGGDSGSGVISGDMLGFPTGIYDGDKDSGSKEIKFFSRSPDDTTVVADSIAADGRFTLQNGQAAVTSTDGSTVTIDDFEVYNDGAPSTVTVVGGQPVISTEPELTPPPPPARPSQTIKGVTGISEVPGLKLKTDSGESHLTAEDIKSHEWWAERRADAYDNEAVFKKADDELGTKSFHFHSDRAKPPVPDYGWVLEGGREGDVSRETDEAVIPYSVVISGKDSEKYIADLLGSKDKTKALPGTTRRADESSAPAEGPAGKEENSREKVPIFGDIPVLGGLYRKERTWTDEEEKEIIAYLAHRKSQPQGESAGLEFETIKLKHLDPRQVEDSIKDNFKDLQDIFRDLPVRGDQAKVLIQALPKNHQIIVFGSKDQREKVKKIVQAIDNQRPQVRIDATIVRTGEDEPELPAASRFKVVPVNPWVMAERDSLSTFALDVDTASYTLCRRYIRGGYLPPAGAVRMEEFINNFNYNYPQRTNPTFAVHAEAAPSPFARREQNLTLLKIGVKARTIGRDQRKAAHLIFVVDASASMDQPDRLPLIQRALILLVNKLSAVDRVSLITCANEARLHLESIPARERDRIRQAINAIQPAGPTNLLAGLKLGYATARRSFAPKQINHVVLCSDGVANVGQTEAEAVLEEVAADRKQGITITCVGVGYGSYNDVFLEALANQGDGSYMFLDSLRQVHRVFVRQLAATLQTVARDARIQVDFNPNRVRRYRLIGYENRDIEDERFRDDTIDAGEVGSGQCSTALYELELIGRPSADRQEDLGTVFVRYRDVETGQFEEISSRLSSAIVRRLTIESAPRFFLAAGAARFAEILRQSEHAQHGNLMDVLRVVEQVSLALPLDRDVRELAELIRKSENLPRSP